MADEQGKLIGPEDEVKLREMWAWFSSQVRNTNNRPRHDFYDDGQVNTQVYIVKTPSDGVPAMSGTTPGSVDCPVYQRLPDGTLQATGLTQTVYNLSASASPGDTYLGIKRDKFGTWFVDDGGGGVGGCTGATGTYSFTFVCSYNCTGGVVTIKYQTISITVTDGCVTSVSVGTCA